MTPSSIFTVAAFFMFVAPGLLYDSISSRTRIGRRESPFKEVSRVALASTVFSVVALAIVVSLGICVSAAFADVAALVRAGNMYAVDHLAKLTLSSITFLALALLGSWLAATVIHRNDTATISYNSAWKKALRDDCPKGFLPSVRLRLSNGSTWMGTVAAYAPDAEHADRELILCQPIVVKPKDKEIQKVNAMWQRVVIKGVDIETLSVRYISANHTDSTTDQVGT